MVKGNILAAIVLATWWPSSPVPAHAGIVDGTANNAHILSDIHALNTAVNSDLQTIENNNANTRADGHKSNAESLQS